MPVWVPDQEDLALYTFMSKQDRLFTELSVPIK